MYTKFQNYLKQELAQIEADGLYKNERIIESPQGAEILVKGKKCLNFCANNYLGLADNPKLIEAAKKGMDARGFGMASVRFICGCQDLHKKLEAKISEFLVLKTLYYMQHVSMPTVVYSSHCWEQKMPLFQMH